MRENDGKERTRLGTLSIPLRPDLAAALDDTAKHHAFNVASLIAELLSDSTFIPVLTSLLTIEMDSRIVDALANLPADLLPHPVDRIEYPDIVGRVPRVAGRAFRFDFEADIHMRDVAAPLCVAGAFNFYLPRDGAWGFIRFPTG